MVFSSFYLWLWNQLGTTDNLCTASWTELFKADCPNILVISIAAGCTGACTERTQMKKAVVYPQFISLTNDNSKKNSGFRISSQKYSKFFMGQICIYWLKLYTFSVLQLGHALLLFDLVSSLIIKLWNNFRPTLLRRLTVFLKSQTLSAKTGAREYISAGLCKNLRKSDFQIFRSWNCTICSTRIAYPNWMEM